MNQSIGALVAKAVTGAVFIAAMFAEPTDTGTKIAGCAIGLGLISWALVPIVKEKLDRRAAAKKNAEREAKLREQLEAERLAAANRPRYCKHCGATTKGDACEYCGSPLDD